MSHNQIGTLNGDGTFNPYGSTVGDIVSADNVTYDNTSSGLTATDVQDALTELNSNLSELKNGLYVEVTPNGTSTWSQKLNELFSLIDTSKITRNAHAITHKSTGADVCYTLALYDNTVIQLQALWSGTNRIDFANFYLRTNGSICSNATIQNAAPTYNDVSSTVCDRTIRFYYN